MDEVWKVCVVLALLFSLYTRYPYQILAWFMYDLCKMENSFSGDVSVLYMGDVTKTHSGDQH